MTNKEKIKESINKDFNKENNYNKIIQKIEKEKNMKVKYNVWKWSLVPMWLIAIIGGVLFINHKDDSLILTPDTPHVNEEDNIKLYINNLDELGLLLFDADVKEISTNGVNILWPEILKDGITIPKDLNKYNAVAIYTRKDRTSEYDILNCYVYNYFNENDNDYKNIRIAFSDTNKPIRDYYFSEEGSRETTINDVKLKIYKYQDIYFVEFNYKDYNFDIETTNITEKELLTLLSSIIK